MKSNIVGLLFVCVFLMSGCASMEGYTPDPNDTPTQGALRFIGTMVNAANQSITGYSNGSQVNSSPVQQSVSVENSAPVDNGESIAVVNNGQSPTTVDATGATDVRLKLAKEKSDDDTIIIPAEYEPRQAINPDSIIVIKPMPAATY